MRSAFTPYFQLNYDHKTSLTSHDPTRGQAESGTWCTSFLWAWYAPLSGSQTWLHVPSGHNSTTSRPLASMWCRALGTLPLRHSAFESPHCSSLERCHWSSCLTSQIPNLRATVTRAISQYHLAERNSLKIKSSMMTFLSRASYHLGLSRRRIFCTELLLLRSRCLAQEFNLCEDASGSPVVVLFIVIVYLVLVIHSSTPGQAEAGGGT